MFRYWHYWFLKFYFQIQLSQTLPLYFAVFLCFSFHRWDMWSRFMWFHEKHAQQVEIFLTSSSDLHSSHHLVRRCFDTTGEKLSGAIEVWYNNLGNPAALIVHKAAGEKLITEVPPNMSLLSTNQRAAVSDDTGGCDTWPQAHHRAGRLDLCTRCEIILWQREYFNLNVAWRRESLLHTKQKQKQNVVSLEQKGEKVQEYL